MDHYYNAVTTPSDFDALTSKDFIIKKFNNFAPGDFNEDGISSRKNIKSVQSYSNEFWRRFIKEYIKSLNKQAKWFRDQRNFGVCNLVLIHQNNIPRSHWPLGRITKVFPSNNNFVWSVQLKLPNSLMIRPEASLCIESHSIWRRGVFWRESNFDILQKNTAWVNCLFITALCFFIIPNLLATREKGRERFSSGDKTFLFWEKFWSFFVASCTFHYSDILCGK